MVQTSIPTENDQRADERCGKQIGEQIKKGNTASTNLAQPVPRPALRKKTIAFGRTVNVSQTVEVKFEAFLSIFIVVVTVRKVQVVV